MDSPPRTKQPYHKYDPDDMYYIRQYRSALLRSNRVKKKTERLDKITKSIISDINWKKLAIDFDIVGFLDPEYEDSIELRRKFTHIEEQVKTFRASLQTQLNEALNEMSTFLSESVRYDAPTVEILEAATTMAQKYQTRANKSKPKKPKHPKKTKQTTPPSPTQAHKKSPSSPKTSPSEASNSSSPKSPTTRKAAPVRSSMTTSPRLLKNFTFPAQRQQPTPSPDSATSPFEFALPNLQTTGHCTSKPPTQQTIKNHFKSTKSSKSKSKSKTKC